MTMEKRRKKKKRQIIRPREHTVELCLLVEGMTSSMASNMRGMTTVESIV